MKKRLAVALMTLVVGAWMMTDAQAQVVERMEITQNDKNEYVAFVDVAFENRGNQAVSLRNADINVFFDIKGGKRIIVEPGDKSDVKAVIQRDGKETAEIKTIRTVKTGKVLFGNTTLGQDEDLEFQPATQAGPFRMEKTLAVVVGKVGDAGTEEKIRRITNIMGDPAIDFVMILEIRSLIGAGFESGFVFPDETNKSLILMRMQPSFKNEYLFK
jgi:hypothetical protein